MTMHRLTAARAAMRERGVDALLVSVGSDLPYLAGYRAMPLERITALVVPASGEAVLSCRNLRRRVSRPPSR